MNFNNRIDELAETFLITKFDNEIRDTTDPERLNYLNGIRSKIVPVKENIYDQQNAEIEKYSYQTKWNKLRIPHRVIKIQEYINSLELTDDIKKKYTKFLVDLINKNDLKSTKDVIYDPHTQKVLSIPSVIIDKDSIKLK